MKRDVFLRFAKALTMNRREGMRHYYSIGNYYNHLHRKLLFTEELFPPPFLCFLFFSDGFFVGETGCVLEIRQGFDNEQEWDIIIYIGSFV